MKQSPYKPEWTPETAGSEFASLVQPGIALQENTADSAQRSRLPELSVSDYVDGIISGNRMLLARAITMVESNSPKHYTMGQDIIHKILPHTGTAIRVGITGVPGVGKSTFIESLGCRLCDRGRRVAVLAVDPSSTVSKGSILGDKTRMENLSR